MKMLSIYKLDDGNNQPLCTLEFGEHFLGRDVLKCFDKRVSNDHVRINFSKDKVEITSNHEINPCFYKASLSKHISIIKYNESQELNDGDVFGFFPDDHWFKIKLEDSQKIRDISDQNIEVKSEILTKDDLQAAISDHDLEGDFKVACDRSDSLNIKDEPASQEQKEDVLNNTDRDESTKINEFDVNVDNVATTSVNSESDIDKSTSRRDRCWYSSKCYRTNEEHKTQFSHPGDPDYDTDPDDTRPLCRYGVQCYSKNSDHRRNFKHSRFAKKPSTTRKHKRDSSSSSENDDEESCKKITTGKRQKDNANFIDSNEDSGNEKEDLLRGRDSDSEDAGISQKNIVAGKRRKVQAKALDCNEFSDEEKEDPFAGSDSADASYENLDESSSD